MQSSAVLDRLVSSEGPSLKLKVAGTVKGSGRLELAPARWSPWVWSPALRSSMIFGSEPSKVRLKKLATI